jgi:hypothetical protein
MTLFVHIDEILNKFRHLLHHYHHHHRISLMELGHLSHKSLSRQRSFKRMQCKLPYS